MFWKRKKEGTSKPQSDLSGYYRSLFMASTDAVMTLSPPTWQFTSGNPATIKMFKAKNEEDFLSYEPWKLSPELQPDGRFSSEKAKEMIEKAIREGHNTFEWIHKRLDGELFFAEVILSRVDLKEKHFLHAIVRDVSEQKQIHEKLKIFLVAIESAFDSIILTDICGNVTYSNKASIETFAYPPEEFVKLNLCQLTGDPNKADRIMEETIKEGKWSGEATCVKKNKEKIFVILSISIIKDQKDSLVGMIGIFRNITECKKMEKCLQDKIHDMEVLIEAAMDREEMMIEMKEKINQLEEKLRKKG